MDKEALIEKLTGIVGPDSVAADAATLYIYSQDMTENEPGPPDVVVMPESIDQVQAIVRLASSERVPLTPFVAGANVGGLAIPAEGGILVDLKRLRRIEVNREDMYAIVEPGVTFGHFRAHLDKHHPDLRYSYPLSPPYTSVMCNALLDGLNNLSYRHGAMSEWINSLEAVLPDGELVRVGAAAVSPHWFGRAPLPDLVGLFIAWQGTTGIVTRMAVQLWPKHPLSRRLFIMTYDVDGTYKLQQRLARLELMDDIASLSWPAGKMLLGATGRLTRLPEEPLCYAYAEVSGQNKREIKVKSKAVEEAIKAVRRQGHEIDAPLDVEMLVKINPEYAKLADFPTTLNFLLAYGGGGFSWVGSFGPPSRWAEGVRRSMEIMERHGYPPLIVARPLKGGHFYALRPIIPFDRTAEGIRERIRAVLEEIAEALLDSGYIPYKAPAWAAAKIMERADPNWVKLLRRVKETLDPDRIMNPGRWGL